MSLRSSIPVERLPNELCKIHHFHIDHNGPLLPPTILHNHCFQFLLGITVVPREIEDNGYITFCGVEKGALSVLSVLDVNRGSLLFPQASRSGHS